MIIAMQIIDFILNKIIARINFVSVKYLLTGREYDITNDSLDKIESLLKKENLIILTWRSTHLTSYFISFAHYILCLITGQKLKFGRWSHCAINIEYNELDRGQMRIFEAIGTGVSRNRFEDIFNCDRACLLRVKGFSPETTSEALRSYLEKQLGKKYDTLFNLQTDNRQSCVELVYHSLKAYGYPLVTLEERLKAYKNLTPQMYYDCGDFEVVYEC